MANTITLKRRIGSVKNTKQITKAMELVAASKMRRAIETAARSREYRRVARAILTRVRELTDVDQHPLFKHRTIKNCLYVVVTSDRGLAGAYNSSVLRQLAANLRTDLENSVSSHVIVIGKQAARFVTRLEGINVVAVYENMPEHLTSNDIRPILNTVVAQYANGQADAVDIIYTDFKSSVIQEVTTDRLLPAAFTEVPVSKDLGKAVFEPSAKAVLDNVTERLIEAQLLQDVLESQASEHSMRMMAMKNATDNANELIDDLTLVFNTARQAAITQELAEITGGAEAMK